MAEPTEPPERPQPQDLIALMPFASELGIQLEQATPEAVRARLAWTAELCTSGGLMHGGALMALADSLGGICAFLNLPPDAQTATVSSSTAFLRGVRGGEVIATARPLHAGRNAIIVQTEIVDEKGAVAQTTQTQAVLADRR
jgi:1,4-dihydroxy-2-naphthoyl-CoA hydrolase